jgi:hypothetical protein
MGSAAAVRRPGGATRRRTPAVCGDHPAPGSRRSCPAAREDDQLLTLTAVEGSGRGAPFGVYAQIVREGLIGLRCGPTRRSVRQAPGLRVDPQRRLHGRAHLAVGERARECPRTGTPGRGAPREAPLRCSSSGGREGGGHLDLAPATPLTARDSLCATCARSPRTAGRRPGRGVVRRLGHGAAERRPGTGSPHCRTRLSATVRRATVATTGAARPPADATHRDQTGRR